MRTAGRTGLGLVGWRRLVVVAALADAVVLFGYGLARGDHEALVLAIVMLVGAGLLRIGSGLLGLLVLAALFVNIEFWMFPAANGNASYRVGVADLLIPASLVAFSLAGFIGAVAAILRLGDPAAGRGAAGPTGILAVRAGGRDRQRRLRPQGAPGPERPGDGDGAQPRPVLAHLHHRRPRRRHQGAGRPPSRGHLRGRPRHLYLLLPHPQPHHPGDARHPDRDLSDAGIA
jgi:hypothetical protein